MLELELRLELDEARKRFFMETLDVDDTLGYLLARYFETVTKIAQASPDTLAALVYDEEGDLTAELRLRAREYLTSPRRTLGLYS